MRKLTNDELNRPSVEEFQRQPKIPVVVVLDNIRSMQNVGAFFRTSDAFAVERLILCGITATPPARDIHKTALGAELSVEWSYEADAVEAVRKLNQAGYATYAVEQVENSISLDRFEVEKGCRYALVFGNEVDGVQQRVVDACHSSIEIPQLGTKHSINVSVAGGVVLWDLFCQFLANR